MREHSAGGVVINDGKVLILKKYYGDWVLPKGKMENNETTDITAVREVEEETGIKAEIIQKIGYARYHYLNQENEDVSKRVDYYLMMQTGGKLIPQKEEGFSFADFVEYKTAIDILRHDSEKKMVINAIKIYRKIRGK
ncbi:MULTISPECIES: NUDIX hydrolase [Helcococcus]|uniref:NUDIX hydrolase n=1 Tax=Helcococcus bovis TaxID=3153252 RepID=A0ABW9F7X0_9FIRM